MKIELIGRVTGAKNISFRNKKEFIDWVYDKYCDRIVDCGKSIDRMSVKDIVDHILPYCYYYLKIGGEA